LLLNNLILLEITHTPKKTPKLTFETVFKKGQIKFYNNKKGNTVAIIKFENPKNRYTESYNTTKSPIWCALFGPFYWLVRRNWFHAVLSVVPAIFTYGLSNIVYAFFANKVNISDYGKKGWVIKDTQLEKTGGHISQKNIKTSQPLKQSHAVKYEEEMSVAQKIDQATEKVNKFNNSNKAFLKRVGMPRIIMFIIISAIALVIIKQQFVPVSDGGSTLYKLSQEK